MRNSPLLNYEPRSKAAGKRVEAPANNYGSCCSALPFPTIYIKYQLPHPFSVPLAFQYVAQNVSGKTIRITMML